jgi:hypothetical protein
LLSNDFFSFVVDVVNWGFKGFAVLEIESSEHANWAEIVLINDQFLVPSKRKFSLTNGSCLGIKDVIILNNIKILVFMILFSLVANANQHETIFCGFPHCVHGALNVSDTIRDTDFVFDFVDVEFAFRVISEVVSFEVPVLVVTGLKPAYH